MRGQAAGDTALVAAARDGDLTAVRERMEFQRTPLSRRAAFTRWLFQAPPVGRHTWSFLAGSGGRPRTAFAIILSL